MSEPALTYLMPVYNLAAWALLLKQPDDFAFPTALFGAAWALRNTLVWKRLDGGVISMGIVAAAAGAERIYFGGADATMILIEAVGSIMVCLNYLIPLAKWNDFKKVFKKGKKSFLWQRIFFWYCASFSVFWAIAAYKTLQRDSLDKFS